MLTVLFVSEPLDRRIKNLFTWKVKEYTRKDRVRNTNVQDVFTDRQYS